ncbi:cysteine protease [Dorcoceras hygrometricum]|uniref:Cysteine protease n=1 Tax=Dorcoceras hygrometricum TaxID=472368 RepID=A0A2Z7APF6_9LAMI|nr:cysteine protease [Dorcoceras hygrometricum]
MMIQLKRCEPAASAKEERFEKLAGEEEDAQTASAKEQRFENLAGEEEDAQIPVQARRRKTLVYVVSHTVEAVVHLRSLGVLTAAGCGIGSVHAVVRSNLLVEPSEVEEGEM